MSLIDQVSVTQDSVIVESDRPEYASFNVCQASSRRFKSCDLFKLSSHPYKIIHMSCLILSAQRARQFAGPRDTPWAAISFSLLLAGNLQVFFNIVFKNRCIVKLVPS